MFALVLPLTLQPEGAAGGNDMETHDHVNLEFFVKAFIWHKHATSKTCFLFPPPPVSYLCLDFLEEFLEHRKTYYSPPCSNYIFFHCFAVKNTNLCRLLFLEFFFFFFFFLLGGDKLREGDLAGGQIKVKLCPSSSIL